MSFRLIPPKQEPSWDEQGEDHFLRSFQEEAPGSLVHRWDPPPQFTSGVGPQEGGKEGSCAWEAGLSLTWKQGENHPKCRQDPSETLCSREAAFSAVTLGEGLLEGSRARAQAGRGLGGGSSVASLQGSDPSCWGLVPWPQLA